MSDLSLTDWLQRLEQQHPVSIDLGLERVGEVAQRLGLGHHATAKVITVAGTNGKGSFVASLDAMLRRHGCRVGCYTSPHLLQFNERVVIDGHAVDDSALVQAFERIAVASEGISLSYFEYTTLAGLLVFAENALDFIILEVGLGGRLDAVNIINTDLAIITSIALDHQDYLGDTRELIAAEKAGILRESTPLISAEADLVALLPEVEQQRKMALIGRDFTLIEADDHKHWHFNSEALSLSDIPDNGLSMHSQAAAIVACQWLLADKAQEALIEQALADVKLAGRFQQIQREDGIHVVLDVAHNPQAAALLHHRLQALPLEKGKKRIAVFHALEDKAISEIIELLKDDMTAWFIGGLNHPRASKVEDLDSLLRQAGCTMISTNKNMRQALSRALSMCQGGDQIIAFGSFFVVAELLTRVNR